MGSTLKLFRSSPPSPKLHCSQRPQPQWSGWHRTRRMLCAWRDFPECILKAPTVPKLSHKFTNSQKSKHRFVDPAWFSIHEWGRLKGKHESNNRSSAFEHQPTEAPSAAGPVTHQDLTRRPQDHQMLSHLGLRTLEKVLAKIPLGHFSKAKNKITFKQNQAISKAHRLSFHFV